MTLSSAYLTVYNAASLALWGHLLLRTLALAPALYAQGRLPELYGELLWPQLAGIQSLAVVEVVHAAVGLVRASPVTTGIQVVGKNLVVWTVMVAFPEIILGPDGQGAPGVWGFLGCVIFWCLAEVIRYGYFVLLLTTGDTPSWLKWLRYSAFIVLYPPGLASEAYLVYLALTRAVDVSLPYWIYLLLGLLSYIPASYIMYTHMLSQRRRVLKKSKLSQ
jgi:very-long-chain (3R)-3-hydroxyacyl-CoA dehydratase